MPSCYAFIMYKPFRTWGCILHSLVPRSPCDGMRPGKCLSLVPRSQCDGMKPGRKCLSLIPTSPCDGMRPGKCLSLVPRSPCDGMRPGRRCLETELTLRQQLYTTRAVYRYSPHLKTEVTNNVCTDMAHYIYQQQCYYNP